MKNEEQILDALCEYETYSTALDELTRSKATLKGLNKEIKDLSPLNYSLSMATFFPLNLPLYSLILFAIIPTVFCEKVYIRTPAMMHDLLSDFIDILDIKDLYPEIYLLNVSRSVFLKIYAKNCEVVLFTGKYDNAMSVQKACKKSLFIYNGSGLNPAIVFKDADLALAAKKIFEMRIFNSGQDCAGVDAIFVESDIKDDYLKHLKKHLLSVRTGKYGDRKVNIGPIQREEYIVEIKEYVDQNKSNIWLEGAIDNSTKIVTPYVFVVDSSNFNDQHIEFFAPIFNVIIFDNEHDLERLLNNDYVVGHSMYTSVFGSNKIIDDYSKKHRVIYNSNINDVENGNEAYGGSGELANFVSYQDKVIARPLLINREIYNFYSNFKLT